MEIGVLGYIGSRNIGDYIQTKAVIDMIHPTNHKVLDREGLHKFKGAKIKTIINGWFMDCLLYTSPSPRDLSTSRMPSSA